MFVTQNRSLGRPMGAEARAGEEGEPSSPEPPLTSSNLHYVSTSSHDPSSLPSPLLLDFLPSSVWWVARSSSMFMAQSRSLRQPTGAEARAGEEGEPSSLEPSLAGSDLHHVSTSGCDPFSLPSLPLLNFLPSSSSMGWGCEVKPDVRGSKLKPRTVGGGAGEEGEPSSPKPPLASSDLHYVSTSSRDPSSLPSPPLLDFLPSSSYSMGCGCEVEPDVRGLKLEPATVGGGGGLGRGGRGAVCSLPRSRASARSRSRASTRRRGTRR